MISDSIQQLITSFKEKPVYTDWSNYDGPKFVTNKITVSIGSFYEKLRYAVDYQDEHVLRRAAIERIIRRLLLFTVTTDIGKAVLEEMVQANYIENDSVPESFAADIQNIILKYHRLKEMIDGDCDIVWSYAAIEIENHLFSPEISERCFMAVFQSVVKYMRPKEQGAMSDEHFNLQVYVACRRALLRESHATLSYALFRAMVPEWRDGLEQSNEVIVDVARRFSKLQAEIKELMNHQVQWKISTRLKNETIFFELLHDITRRNGADSDMILADEERVSVAVRSMLENTHQNHRAKVSRSATRAIIYVLITKVIIGLAIELPYEILILNEVNYVALAINIIFFPILMILMTKTIKYPGDDEIGEVVRAFGSFISGEERDKQFVKVMPKSNLQRIGHAAFATVFFAFTFGMIIQVLDQFHFNPASIFLFLFFLCVVTYMGLRIRTKAREWAFDKEDESFTGILWFLFVLPITRTGRWVSEQMSSFNVFVFFFDFILETPFKMILGSFDSFVSYVKESRRDGL